MPATGTRVVLCADDFGLTPGVSRGILDLAAAGRISATGAMTNMPHWEPLAPFLKAVEGRIGVGLHLNLTTGRPLAPMPGFAPDGRFPALGALLARSLAGALDPAILHGEIERQLNAFEAAFGRPPDFVDGHQHVHVLPGVRGALLRALAGRGLAGRLWLRDPSDGLRAIAGRGRSIGKALLVRALSSGFRRAARAAGFATNEGFSGFSAFAPSDDLAAAFARHLAHLGPAPVVMCHPGHVDDALRGLDPVVESRGAEQAYLASDAFGALLAERGITLAQRP